MFACGYSGVRVAAFFEKLAHFFAFVVKVGVVTAEASLVKMILFSPEKLKLRNVSSAWLLSLIYEGSD